MPTVVIFFYLTKRVFAFLMSRTPFFFSLGIPQKKNRMCNVLAWVGACVAGVYVPGEKYLYLFVYCTIITFFTERF